MQALKFVASEVLVDANAILNVYVFFWLYQTLDIFSYKVGEGRMPEILSRYQRDTVKNKQLGNDHLEQQKSR